ncbi:hypothetical protein ES708_21303 [subsurface metagenome]
MVKIIETKNQKKFLLLIAYIVYSIEYRVSRQERERKMKKAPFFFYLTTSSKFTLTIIIISKLSFIISLFGEISKNLSLIIYADLKITRLDKKSIDYMVSSIKQRKREENTILLFI